MPHSWAREVSSSSVGLAGTQGAGQLDLHAAEAGRIAPASRVAGPALRPNLRSKRA
ncbi:hypothetical protein ARTHRO9V_200109 [Arthrobacter sp. 9V]|nr:hypothetical protein ARTHRO9V_200109 [Arthrobacter sp. 9V]